MAIPVVLFTHSRPDKTAAVLDALRRQTRRVERLLVFADGPRHPGEDAAVRHVRDLCRAGPGTVTIHERPGNFGCTGNILHGLDQALREFAAVAVLEDDTLPATNWYEAVCRLLDAYRDARNVFSVGCFPSICHGALGGQPYDTFCSPRFSCWGWGTWADRWRDLGHELMHGGRTWQPQDISDDGGNDLRQLAVMHWHDWDNAIWDVRVATSTAARGLLHAHTINYLVSNIGLERCGDGVRAFMAVHNAVRDELPARFAPPARTPEGCAAVRTYVHSVGCA